MQTLNIIGSGRLGSTLGKLWADNQILQVRAICNRTLESAVNAAAFIGHDAKAVNLTTLPVADIVLIATPDEQIELICAELVTQNKLLPHTIVFHCSGALSSTALSSAAQIGCKTASVHPIHSFAYPQLSVATFSNPSNNTYCAAEGDDPALAVIIPLFAALNAQVFKLTAESKTSYHAALVFASNYLVSLVEVSLKLFEHAGIERSLALDAIQPILLNTIQNIHQLGTGAALTGPIARRDTATITAHLETLTHFDSDMQTLYKTLGRVALAISLTDPNAKTEKERGVENLLQSSEN